MELKKVEKIKILNKRRKKLRMQANTSLKILYITGKYHILRFCVNYFTNYTTYVGLKFRKRIQSF